MRSIGILSAVIAFGTTACAVPFADADFAPYRGDGAATLEGQAYLDVGTNDQKFVTCLEQPVYLVPATAFDSHVFNMHRGLRGIVSGAGPAGPYWRQSICDSQGRFIFSRVPSGDWFAVTQVRWPGTLIYKEGRETLVKRVSLRAGQNTALMSSRLRYDDEVSEVSDLAVFSRTLWGHAPDN